MRALWVPASQLGAVVPVVPVVERLVADGVEVTAVAPGALEMVRSSVSTAVRFVAFGTTDKNTGREKASAASSRLEHVETQEEKEQRILARTVREVEDIGTAVEMSRPDVILGDPFVMGTTLAGEILGVPVVSLIHHLFDEGATHYWPHQHVWMRRNPGSPDGFVQWWNGLRAYLGLPPESRSVSQAQWWPHSVTASVLLVHPLLRYRPRPLPDYVRVAVPEFWEPSCLVDKSVVEAVVARMRRGTAPQVLLTSSSLWQPDTGFVRSTLQACEELGWDVTTTIPSDRDGNGMVDSAHSFLPHSRLLPAADVVVTGAGLGTVLRAIDSRTPLVMCPCSWTNPKARKRDTTHIAEVLIATGVAERVFQEDATPEAVKAALLRITDRGRAMSSCFDEFDTTLRENLARGTVLDTAALSALIRRVAADKGQDTA